MPFSTPEQRKLWSRDYYAREKNRVLEINRRWRRKNREKVRAHSAVARALRAGRLQVQPCEECGSHFVHAHHDDYTKPLEVRWLCPIHHGQVSDSLSG